MILLQLNHISWLFWINLNHGFFGRVRFGYAHVVNNDYEPWGIYAIGGSMHPAIRSEGNRFLAPNDTFKKQVFNPKLIHAYNEYFLDFSQIMIEMNTHAS